MGQVSSINHIAVCTGNLKAQIEFFTDVMGMELVALYTAPDSEDSTHCYLKLNDTCHLQLVYTPDTGDIESIDGVTHARHPAKGSAPGTVQHIAFNVDTVEDMLNLRDRIRSRGVNCLGPLDHGMCHSMYFAGPEHLTLEVATSEQPIRPELWIDQEVVDLAGINNQELESYLHPPSYHGQQGKVPQPQKDQSKYHISYTGLVQEKALEMSDEELNNSLSYLSTPPNLKN